MVAVETTTAVTGGRRVTARKGGRAGERERKRERERES